MKQASQVRRFVDRRSSRSSVVVFRAVILLAGAVICLAGKSLADETPASAPATTAVTAQLAAIPAEIASIYEGAAPQSLDQLRQMEAHQQRLVAAVMPCVVGLQIGQAQGSGVIVSPEGLILTAAHVVQRPNQTVTIILQDGTRTTGTTLGLDRSSDAGMVKINATPPQANGDAPSAWPYLEIGKSESLAVGQWILTMGHPGGYQRGRKPVVRIGRILSRDDDIVVTDGTLVGGDSGGPLMDMQGRVVGIHSRIGGSLTANMHVPAEVYREVWDRLVAGEMWGDVPRGSPYIGVQGDPETQDAKIVHVEPGQPADRAGIQVGDVVLQFDDKEVATFSSLAAMVSECEPGMKVNVIVRRGEETLKLELEIGRRR